MTEVGMHEAKTQLSKLVERALDGEEIVITRRGQAVVRLVPERPRGGFASLQGVWKGDAWIADDFDVLPDDLARAFGVID